MSSFNVATSLNSPAGIPARGKGEAVRVRPAHADVFLCSPYPQRAWASWEVLADVGPRNSLMSPQGPFQTVRGLASTAGLCSSWNHINHTENGSCPPFLQVMDQTSPTQVTSLTPAIPLAPGAPQPSSWLTFPEAPCCLACSYLLLSPVPYVPSTRTGVLSVWFPIVSLTPRQHPHTKNVQQTVVG